MATETILSWKGKKENVDLNNLLAKKTRSDMGLSFDHQILYQIRHIRHSSSIATTTFGVVDNMT